MQQKKAACTTLLFGSTSGLNLPKYLIFYLFRGSNPYSCLKPHFCIFFEPFFVRFGLTLIWEIQPSNLPVFTKKPPKSAVFSMCIFFVYPLWSRWQDSNLRPLRPERSALPNWATPRQYTLYHREKGISLYHDKLHYGICSTSVQSASSFAGLDFTVFSHYITHGIFCQLFFCWLNHYFSKKCMC